MENGVVVNEKYRVPGKKAGEKLIWQKTGGKRTFYNADAMDDPALLDGRQALIITEVRSTASPRSTAASRWRCRCRMARTCRRGWHRAREGRHPRVRVFCGITGSGCARSSASFIAMDGDEAGRHMASELVRRLSASRCMFVTYPEGCKDANDVRMKLGPEACRQDVQRGAALPGARRLPSRALP